MGKEGKQKSRGGESRERERQKGETVGGEVMEEDAESEIQTEGCKRKGKQ